MGRGNPLFTGKEPKRRLRSIGNLRYLYPLVRRSLVRSRKPLPRKAEYFLLPLVAKSLSNYLPPYPESVLFAQQVAHTHKRSDEQNGDQVFGSVEDMKDRTAEADAG